MAGKALSAAIVGQIQRDSIVVWKGQQTCLGWAWEYLHQSGHNLMLGHQVPGVPRYISLAKGQAAALPGAILELRTPALNEAFKSWNTCKPPNLIMSGSYATRINRNGFFPVVNVPQSRVRANH